MRILNFADDNTPFFKALANAKRRVLVVDYDSVVAPVCDAVTSSIPCPTISELLDCIMTTGRTRVVLIRRSQTAGFDRHVPGPAPDVWGMDGPADPAVQLPALLAKLGEDSAVGYVSHRDWPWGAVMETKGDSDGFCAAGSKDSLQFLVDWLRICGGEIC